MKYVPVHIGALVLYGLISHSSECRSNHSSFLSLLILPPYLDACISACIDLQVLQIVRLLYQLPVLARYHSTTNDQMPYLLCVLRDLLLQPPAAGRCCLFLLAIIPFHNSPRECCGCGFTLGCQRTGYDCPVVVPTVARLVACGCMSQHSCWKLNLRFACIFNPCVRVCACVCLCEPNVGDDKTFSCAPAH